MGVQLTSLVKGTDIEIQDMKNRAIAIDAFNWLYQFLSTIRDRDTGQPLMDSKGRVTSHLSGLFYRTVRLIEAGIRPVYVFDGRPPEFKALTVAARSLARRQAEERWKEAVALGRKEEARKAAMAATRLTGDLIDQSKKLLEYMGVQVVQAPSEGEAQAAWMCKERLVWTVASQDYDSLMFGSPRLVRNLSISGKRKLVKKDVYAEIRPELMELSKVLKEFGLTREQLVIIGMLVGTDFNPGIRGIGPKTALKLVKEHRKLDKVIAEAEKKSPWEGPEPEDVLDFFMNPPAKEVKIRTPALHPEKLKSFLVDKFEFSEVRIDRGISRIEKKKPGKHSLGKWLK